MLSQCSLCESQPAGNAPVTFLFNLKWLLCNQEGHFSVFYLYVENSVLLFPQSVRRGHENPHAN